jgi:hypothetical protein
MIYQIQHFKHRLNHYVVQIEMNVFVAKRRLDQYLNDMDWAYPSGANPKPESRTFFSGGYIIRNYSTKINAIQVELPYDTRTGDNKQMNAKTFAQVIVEYMKINNLLMSN